MKVWFRWFSLSNRWYSGSMLVFGGVEQWWHETPVSAFPKLSWETFLGILCSAGSSQEGLVGRAWRYLRHWSRVGKQKTGVRGHNLYNVKMDKKWWVVLFFQARLAKTITCIYMLDSHKWLPTCGPLILGSQQNISVVSYKSLFAEPCSPSKKTCYVNESLNDDSNMCISYVMNLNIVIHQSLARAYFRKDHNHTANTWCSTTSKIYPTQSIKFQSLPPRNHR